MDGLAKKGYSCAIRNFIDKKTNVYGLWCGIKKKKLLREGMRENLKVLMSYKIYQKRANKRKKKLLYITIMAYFWPLEYFDLKKNGKP